MSKKGWTRILMVIVAGLWGYNIYRTVENYQVKNENLEVQQNTTMSFAPVMFNKDTFELNLPKLDPFLKGQKNWQSNSNSTSNANSASNSIRKNPNLNTLPPVVNIKWPVIKYYGFLKNYEADRKLCMLNIDGRNYRFFIGDEKEKIQIIEAYPDSVRVAYNNAIKTFLK